MPGRFGLTNPIDMVKFLIGNQLTVLRNHGPIFISKEGVMFEVTQPAVTQIAEYFKGKDVKPIRIFLNEGG